MNCKEFEALLIPFVEKELDGETARLMEEHRAQCAACRARAEEVSLLFQDLSQLDEDGFVPPSFQEGWRKAVEEEAMKMQKEQPETGRGKKPRGRNGFWMPLVSVAAAVVFLAGGTMIARNMNLLAPEQVEAGMYSAGGGAPQAAPQNGAVKSRTMANEESQSYTAEPEGMMDEGAAADEAGPGVGISQETKIIRSASLTLTTMDFDGDVEALKALCESLGGWVEYTGIYGDEEGRSPRSANLTLRVPQTALDDFVSLAKNGRRTASYSETARDVTENYYDTALRLSTQKEKMRRLQEMLKTAAEMSDLIEIESAIADTQYQIDSYESRLRSLDQQVTYSTVDLYLKESLGADAAKEQALSLGERMNQGFTSSIQGLGQFLQDMAVFLTMAAPWLIGLGIIGGACALIVKKRRKK